MMLSLSFRYAFPHQKALRSRAMRIMLTVALSLIVVTLVVSVMNFLQGSRFDTIRDVRSFDCTVEGDCSDEIAALLPSAEVFVYGEGEAITAFGSYLVRYIDSSYDGGLRFYSGDGTGLVVPYSLYRKNGWNDVTLSMLKSGKRVTALKNESYPISGVYYTGLGSEFDDTMLFLPLSLADDNVTVRTAVKKIGKDEVKILEDGGYSLLRWQDAESSLYGAFLVEKALMYGVLSLLFIIISVSMKSSVALFCRSREREMAELEILGLEKRKVRRVVFLSFLIVIVLGILLALVLSPVVLKALETYSRKSSRITSMTLTLPCGGFLFFSLFMVAVTVFSTRHENRKREKRELYEVIHAE